MAGLTELLKAIEAEEARQSAPKPSLNDALGGAPLYSPQTRFLFPQATDENTGQAMMVGPDNVPGDPTMVTPIIDNLVGIENETMTPGEKAAQAINNAAEGLSFGVVGDEANAAFDAMIGRGGYEDRRDLYRANKEQFTAENPVASIGSEVLGAMAGPGKVIGAAKGLGRRMLGGAATGAGGGSLYGFMAGEGGVQDRIENARNAGLVGGAIGGAIPAVGAAYRGIRNAVGEGSAIRRAAQNAPTTDELRNLAQQGYRQIDEAGVQIRPEAFDRLRGNMQRAGDAVGYDDLPGPGSLTPKSARVSQIGQSMSDEMAAAADQNPALPFSSLDRFRRQAGAAAANLNDRADSKVGTTFIQELDDFVQKLSKDDIVAGDVETLQDVIPKARELYSRAMRSGMIDEAIEASENYVSGPASGIRNQFRRILNNPRLSRGFSDAEKRALRRVVNGTFPERLVHLLGGGLGQIMTTGGATALGASAGIPGAIAGLAAGTGISALTRGASEAIAARQADIARRVIASGLARGGSPVPAAERARLEAVMQRLLTQPGVIATQAQN